MFITIEGVEGAGKSVQAALFYKWLNKQNVRCLLTKEPGSGEINECKQIRQILLDPTSNLDNRAELFLFLADRAQHVGKLIKNNKNKVIISDRYMDSTHAYQVYGRGLEEEKIMPILKYACYDLEPDITFILDASVELCLKRAKSSNVEFKGGDRMEKEKLEFHSKIRDGFLEIAKRNKNRCIILDGSKSIGATHNEIIRKYLEYIK